MRIIKVIDKSLNEPELRVCDSAPGERLNGIYCELESIFGDTVDGTDERGERVILRTSDVSRFYAVGQKVLARTAEGEFTVSRKLYELESSLEQTRFFRISKSEIVNLRQISRLDMSIAGTIRIIMRDGTETYTSRRNVARLKQILLKEKGGGRA